MAPDTSPALPCPHSLHRRQTGDRSQLYSLWRVRCLAGVDVSVTDLGAERKGCSIKSGCKNICQNLYILLIRHTGRRATHTIVQKRCCALGFMFLPCFLVSSSSKFEQWVKTTCLWCRTGPVCPQYFLFWYLIGIS